MPCLNGSVSVSNQKMTVEIEREDEENSPTWVRAGYIISHRKIKYEKEYLDFAECYINPVDWFWMRKINDFCIWINQFPPENFITIEFDQ